MALTTSSPAITGATQRGLPLSPPRHGTFITNVGLISVGLTLLLVSVTGSTAAPNTTIPWWAMVAAVIALLLGIPHGAVDHLLLRTSLTPKQWAIGALAYISLAAAAALAIFAFPAAAFIVVIAATVWHFGTGDVEATSELQGLPPETGPFRIMHAIAAGGAPVLIPLTSPLATETLISIQPKLAGLLTDNVLLATRGIVFALIVIVLIQLIHRGQLRSAIELVALTALGLFATPLLAFAVYFAFWHALRHTARIALDQDHTISISSVSKVFAQGLPALIGTIVVMGILVATFGFTDLPSSWLWFGLVIVWGLTVPHMTLVAAFDRRIRNQRLTTSSNE